MPKFMGLVAASCLVVAVACTPAPPAVDTSADVDAITQLAAREIAEFSSGQTTNMGTIFTSDVVTMPPNAPAIQGLAALTTWASGLNEMFTLTGEYLTNDVSVSGDLAVHRFTGRLTMTPRAGGDAMTETVKGLHILRRQADGTWRITQDVWNTDTPPPAPPMGGGTP